jgi:hypothetical protein
MRSDGRMNVACNRIFGLLTVYETVAHSSSSVDSSKSRHTLQLGTMQQLTGR